MYMKQHGGEGGGYMNDKKQAQCVCIRIYMCYVAVGIDASQQDGS